MGTARALRMSLPVLSDGEEEPVLPSEKKIGSRPHPKKNGEFSWEECRSGALPFDYVAVRDQGVVDNADLDSLVKHVLGVRK